MSDEIVFSDRMPWHLLPPSVLNAVDIEEEKIQLSNCYFANGEWPKAYDHYLDEDELAACWFNCPVRCNGHWIRAELTSDQWREIEAYIAPRAELLHWMQRLGFVPWYWGKPHSRKSFAADDRGKVSSMSGGKCSYCDCGIFEHVDHIVPVSRGGSNLISNLAPSCSPCNLQKKNRTIWEWLH